MTQESTLVTAEQQQQDASQEGRRGFRARLHEKATDILHRRASKPLQAEANKGVMRLGVNKPQLLVEKRVKLEKQVTDAPDDIAAKAALIDVSYRLGAVDATRDLVDKVIAAEPGNAEALTMSGILAVGEAIDKETDPDRQKQLLDKAKKQFEAAPEHPHSILFLQVDRSSIVNETKILSDQIRQGHGGAAMEGNDVQQQLALLRLARKFQQAHDLDRDGKVQAPIKELPTIVEGGATDGDEYPNRLASQMSPEDRAALAKVAQERIVLTPASGALEPAAEPAVPSAPLPGAEPTQPASAVSGDTLIGAPYPEPGGQSLRTALRKRGRQMLRRFPERTAAPTQPQPLNEPEAALEVLSRESRADGLVSDMVFADYVSNQLDKGISLEREEAEKDPVIADLLDRREGKEFDLVDIDEYIGSRSVAIVAGLEASFKIPGKESRNKGSLFVLTGEKNGKFILQMGGNVHRMLKIRSFPSEFTVAFDTRDKQQDLLAWLQEDPAGALEGILGKMVELQKEDGLSNFSKRKVGNQFDDIRSVQTREYPDGEIQQFTRDTKGVMQRVDIPDEPSS